MLNYNNIKILYIIPPYFSREDTQKPVFTIPYGILSIDSYIKKNSVKHIESKLLDLNLNHNELHGTIRQYNPNIVAISTLFDTQYKYLKYISSTVKECNIKTLVVTGGGPPTSLYKNILEDIPYIDAICYGEGEIPMADLVESTDYINTITTHKSWINKESFENGKLLINSFIQNLDDIPEFDYSLIDLNNYNSRSLDKLDNTKNKREMSIHTSRGCPYNCIFCGNTKLHGKKIRYMSTKKVISEVRSMINNHGLTTLIIEDDNFLFNKKRAKEILKCITELKIKIEFPNGISVYAIDDEIGKLLKDAGTSIVPLAIESCSDYILQKIIKKPLSVKMIKPAVDLLRKNTIRVHAFIVIGIPGETDEHRRETLNIIKEIGFDWVHIFIAIPVSGSRLYDICINNNYLVDNDITKHNIFNANIKSPGIDPKEIEKFAYYMNLNLNFISNYNMRIGKYETAEKYFRNVVEKYPDHNIARHFLNKSLRIQNSNI